MAALADILAKMRKVADSHASIGPSTLRVYADRIEEEVKREAVTDSHGLGNAAAMHELVRCIVKSLGGKAEVAPTTMTPHEVAILNQCRAALAKPARNCDVPHKDGHELWLRWQAYCAEIYPSRMSFSTWLLDLAQEGGAK